MRPKIDMVSAIRDAGPGAFEDSTPEREAVRWGALGFTAATARPWLRARCYDATAAHELAREGVTPEGAAQETDAGSGGYRDTIAFKLSQGDLSTRAAVLLACGRDA